MRAWGVRGTAINAMSMRYQIRIVFSIGLLTAAVPVEATPGDRTMYLTPTAVDIVRIIEEVRRETVDEKTTSDLRPTRARANTGARYRRS